MHMKYHFRLISYFAFYRGHNKFYSRCVENIQSIQSFILIFFVYWESGMMLWTAILPWIDYFIFWNYMFLSEPLKILLRRWLSFCMYVKFIWTRKPKIHIVIFIYYIVCERFIAFFYCQWLFLVDSLYFQIYYTCLSRSYTLMLVSVSRWMLLTWDYLCVNADEYFTLSFILFGQYYKYNKTFFVLWELIKEDLIMKVTEIISANAVTTLKTKSLFSL